MSEQEDKSQKTLPPTEQKLQELRKKGEIPRSNELNSAVALSGLALISTLFGGQILLSSADAMLGFFQIWAGGRAESLQDSATVYNLVFQAVFIPIGVVLAAGCFVVLTVAAQKGFVFAPEKLAPKLSRISMLKTAKHKFGPPGLFEFAKSLTKLIVITVVLGTLSLMFQAEILGASRADAAQIVLFKFDLVIRILVVSAVIALTLGALDFLWQRQHFLKSHMMSRQDIRDEIKRSEGDPDQKAERQRRAQEISQNRMLHDVPKADVIVVNPTHYAVALQWSRKDQGAAPICVAKGVDLVATKIREIAQEHAIPVFSDPPTARSIHASIEIGQEIAFEHYKAVAAAIRFADKIRQKSRAAG